MTLGLLLWPALVLQAADGQAATALPPAVASEPANPPDPDAGILPGRRKPGYNPRYPDRLRQTNPGAVSAPPPEAFPSDQIPVPDRWRLIEALGIVRQRWWDPYHQNTLKGDRPIDRAKVPWLPITGNDWFFNVGLTSDTVFEPRTLPLPVGDQTTARSGSVDPFGRDASTLFSQTVIASAALIKGSTTFKPPEIEYRLTLAFNFNRVHAPELGVLSGRSGAGTTRTDHALGIQEAFVDYHLRNVSDRYDFDAVRVGIQPFQADFRGFLFNDENLGVRLFGNRDGNRVQYNLAAFWRLEKDTNSGLNNVWARPRDDWVLLANLYRQDLFRPGLTGQLTLVWNRNREGNRVKFGANGFPVRPALLGTLRGHDYDVVYLGANGDGRFGRIGLTASTYAALGHDSQSFFTGRAATIRAGFAAAELSYDQDWVRARLSGLIASGDSNPNDNKETGFDAINENPVFAGADTSYWIRQSIPFVGGGRAVALNGRNGILNDLRTSKEQGQSNFNNPGTVLLGAGGDFDLTPEVRLTTNANHLWFANTSSLQTLRNEGSIPRDIGWDLSAAAIWRPKATQNAVVRLSAALLLPGAGFRDLFANSSRDRHYLSILANLVLSY